MAPVVYSVNNDSYVSWSLLHDLSPDMKFDLHFLCLFAYVLLSYKMFLMSYCVSYSVFELNLVVPSLLHSLVNSKFYF